MIFEIILLVLLVGLDQWTKYMTLQSIAITRESVQIIDGVLEFHYVENTGAAFGSFSGNTGFLVILVFIIVGLVLYYKRKVPKTPEYRPLHILAIFILAGAFGNLIDRIRLQYVVDMIHFYWFEFPVFNVADIYVTCSAVVMVILLLTKYKDLEL